MAAGLADASIESAKRPPLTIRSASSRPSGCALTLAQRLSRAGDKPLQRRRAASPSQKLRYKHIAGLDGIDHAWPVVLRRRHDFRRADSTIDNRRACGDVRVKTIGQLDDEIRVVIIADRQGVRRIISARRANRKERKQWQSFANL